MYNIYYTLYIRQPINIYILCETNRIYRVYPVYRDFDFVFNKRYSKYLDAVIQVYLSVNPLKSLR